MVVEGIEKEGVEVGDWACCRTHPSYIGGGEEDKHTFQKDEARIFIEGYLFFVRNK